MATKYHDPKTGKTTTKKPKKKANPETQESPKETSTDK